MFAFSPVYDACIRTDVTNYRRIFAIILRMMTYNTIASVTKIFAFVFGDIVVSNSLYFKDKGYFSSAESRSATMKQLPPTNMKSLAALSAFAVFNASCTVG